MDKADGLNTQLEESWPAAATMLSDLGRRAAFPDGVPAQAAEARDCLYNGSIGQVTDGAGNALPLPSLERMLGDLDRNPSLLYPPQLGLRDLREAWAERTTSRASGAPFPLPMVTVALTHGISLCADLFTDADTTVLMPSPSWGNYKAVFGLRRQAKIQRWRVFDEHLRFNVAGFRDALSRISGRCLVILNFPGNPTGYTPTDAEADGIVSAIKDHPDPLVVVCDDAYQGLVFEETAAQTSIFYRLAADTQSEKNLIVKVDGATKELAFFGGRVGFLTFACDPEPAEALLDKAAAIARATVSSAPAPSQVAVLSCLRSPTLEDEVHTLRAVLSRRYRILKRCMPRLEAVGISAYPFNSGCFALLRLPTGVDAHVLRKRLITEQSVGFVAMPAEQALRVAYCSMHENQIEEALSRLATSLS